MIRSIVPQDRAFFEAFDDLGGHIVEAAELLVAILAGDEERERGARRIKEVEQHADETVHATLERLHRTFVTPIDREDIHQLVVRLDDILDQATAAGTRLDLYRPQRVPVQALDLARALLETARFVREMVGLLRNLKHKKQILELAVRVNTLENESDVIRRSAVVHLLEHEKDPFEFIKAKEIIDFIEDAVDCCEDVSDIIEGIVLKHS